MAYGNDNNTRRDARYAQPIVGVVDPLGNLEVAGPIPAEEMGLRPRRRVRLVGTAYDPATVGEAYAERGATPRYLVRTDDGRAARGRRTAAVGAGRGVRIVRGPDAGLGAGRSVATSTGRPTRDGAYQDRIAVRIAKRGEETHVVYRLHEPALAGQTVAMVTGVERRAVPLWLVAPAAVAACMAAVVAGVLLGWRDPNARRGYYQGKSEGEIRSDLDAEVDWESMEISVASAMEVAEGGTTVEARLENVAANHCDQRVRMYMTDDPSDVLYESGAIAPGEYVQTIELAHPLAVGTHGVTVEFQGYSRTPALVSDEGVLLGHDTFGASCAAEVSIYCRPANVAVGGAA